MGINNRGKSRATYYEKETKFDQTTYDKVCKINDKREYERKNSWSENKMKNNNGYEKMRMLL